MTPPATPAASPTAEARAVLSEPKAQPTISGPADEAGKAPTPAASPALAAAPAASPTPEARAALSEPKAQTATPGADPADEAGKAPTPAASPALAAAAAPTGVAEPQPASPEANATPAAQSSDPAIDAGKASNLPPSGSGVAASPPVASETKQEAALANAGQEGDPAKAVSPAPAPSVVAAARPETEEPAGAAGKPSPATPKSANEGPQPQESAQVLIVMARPDVKDVADLRDKSVLVDGAPLISNEQLKASFAAAGASGAEFKHGDTNDIERFVRGEFAAAVVGVVTPGLATYTREIPGFRLLRVAVAPLAKP